MQVKISNKSPEYIKMREALGYGKYNGAYYYAEEIQNIMLPLLETDRDIYTIHVPNIGSNHALIWAHSNVDIRKTYRHWKNYHDLVFIVSQHRTGMILHNMFPKDRIIYLPLSVDTHYLDQFKYNGSRVGCIYFGNRWAKRNALPNSIPLNATFIHDRPREWCLRMIAQTKDVYASGRCYIESLYLNPNGTHRVKTSYDSDDLFVLDTRDAVITLQKKLNEIDKITDVIL